MRHYLAEGVGTFTLVFCGTGAIVINGATNGLLGHAGVAATFGLTVMVLIELLGDVSGAHFNPAVTLACWATGRFAGRWVLGYLGSQVAGAVLASGLLRLLFPHAPDLGVTRPAGPAWAAFLLEVVLTFGLTFTILRAVALSARKNFPIGLVVGAVVGIEALLAGPFSGASMNPARSLAPALVSGNWVALWVYLLAPPLGALAAALLFRQRRANLAA